MKAYILGFFLLFSTYSVSAQKDTVCVNAWVDSLFCENFKQMEYAVENNLMYDNYVDRYFVLLLSFLSGIECSSIHYSGFCYFDKKKLEDWKAWYNSNKCKITKENVLWGLSILKSESKTQNQLDSLYKLKIIN
jgi:hypothetical protein